MKNPNKKVNYISVAELAKMLGISRIAVFNKIKKGQVPAEKIGRAYAVPMEYVRNKFFHDTGVITEEKKKDIVKVVDRVIKEYGETLKLLGKE
jgi:excisionase family DNA binding protein